MQANKQVNKWNINISLSKISRVEQQLRGRANFPPTFMTITSQRILLNVTNCSFKTPPTFFVCFWTLYTLIPGHLVHIWWVPSFKTPVRCGTNSGVKVLITFLVCGFTPRELGLTGRHLAAPTRVPAHRRTVTPFTAVSETLWGSLMFGYRATLIIWDITES